MSNDMTKAIYVGRGGAHYNGIPARDITEAEWEQLTPKQQKLVSKSPLYEMVVRKKKPTAKKAGE
jgi:hypothetical protein